MSSRSELGEVLKKIRVSKNISQDLLTERSGLLRHQIISIEKGKSNYTVDNLLKYLHGVGVTMMDLHAHTEQFEFQIIGSSMTLAALRNKITERIIEHQGWLYKLDDTSPGHYGVNDCEVELNFEDVIVNIPQRTFEFGDAGFSFDLNLISSRDGVSHRGQEIASGNGTFCFTEGENDVKIEELNIEVDLDLFSEEKKVRIV